MFAAQMAGKLPASQKNAEDLLTSNVFGLYRYLRPELGLLQFVKTAKRVDGVEFRGFDQVESIDLQFWPWLQEQGAKGAEPDVLVEMVASNQRKCLVLIEAKYLSTKSSYSDDSPEPNDQLAREMYNLRKVALRKGIDDYALIYITAHTFMPVEDIKEAISELNQKTGDGNGDRFFWTTWRRLPRILAQAATICERPLASMLTDLRTIILDLGLTFFEGVTYSEWTLPGWEFETLAVQLVWETFTLPNFAFEGKPVKFTWEPATSPKIPWRWSS